MLVTQQNAWDLLVKGNWVYVGDNRGLEAGTRERENDDVWLLPRNGVWALIVSRVN